MQAWGHQLSAEIQAFGRQLSAELAQHADRILDTVREMATEVDETYADPARAGGSPRSQRVAAETPASPLAPRAWPVVAERDKTRPCPSNVSMPS
jgi:hypothetical protein